jgi:hypothetical protein
MALCRGLPRSTIVAFGGVHHVVGTVDDNATGTQGNSKHERLDLQEAAKA